MILLHPQTHNFNKNTCMKHPPFYQQHQQHQQLQQQQHHHHHHHQYKHQLHHDHCHRYAQNTLLMRNHFSRLNAHDSSNNNLHYAYRSRDGHPHQQWWILSSQYHSSSSSSSPSPSLSSSPSSSPSPSPSPSSSPSPLMLNRAEEVEELIVKLFQHPFRQSPDHPHHPSINHKRNNILYSPYGTIHVTAVYQSSSLSSAASASLAPLRLINVTHPQSPKNILDFFVLNFARVIADASITTGKILRYELALDYTVIDSHFAKGFNDWLLKVYSNCSSSSNNCAYHIHNNSRSPHTNIIVLTRSPTSLNYSRQATLRHYIDQLDGSSNNNNQLPQLYLCCPLSAQPSILNLLQSMAISRGCCTQQPHQHQQQGHVQVQDNNLSSFIITPTAVPRVSIASCASGGSSLKRAVDLAFSLSSKSICIEAGSDTVMELYRSPSSSSSSSSSYSTSIGVDTLLLTIYRGSIANESCLMPDPWLSEADICQHFDLLGEYHAEDWSFYLYTRSTKQQVEKEAPLMAL